MVKVTLHRLSANVGREVTAGIIVFTTTAFNLFLIPSMLAEAGAPVAEATTSVALVIALALFFTPLFAAVLAAAVAPLLIAVGMLMMRGVTGVSWRASEDALPALVTVMATVLTMDIASGLAFGMGSYVICYYLAGRRSEMHQSSYLLTLVLGIYLMLYAQ